MPAAPETLNSLADLPPVGDIYKTSLNEAQGNEPAEKPEGEAEPEAKPAPAKKADKKAAEPVKAAPKSALDAALGAEPVEAKKPEEAPAEEDPLKDYGEDAKVKNWKGLRGVAEKALAEVKELRGKVGKAEPDPAVMSELSTLKQTLAEREKALAEREAKLSEYNDAMTAINLELHPDFRREFIDGRNELVQNTAAKLKNYGGNPEALSEALAMPEGKRRDAAVEEALADLSDSAKAKILRGISEVEALDERRQKAMKAPQQSFEELERKTLAQQQKAHEEAERVKATEFERITRELHKSVPTLSLVDESLEGGKEWNAAVKQAREKAFGLFAADAAFPDMVAAAVKGQDYDRIASMLIAERKESATLRAQLAEFDGSMPDIKGGKAPKKSASEALIEKSPGQIYEETKAKFSGESDE